MYSLYDLHGKEWVYTGSRIVINDNSDTCAQHLAFVNIIIATGLLEAGYLIMLDRVSAEAFSTVLKVHQ